jgi:acetyl-CoA carboxylase carboxyl transferase subunit beta
MSWFQRSDKNIESNTQKYMPDGLWTKCPSCSEIIYKKQLEENLFTCFKCNYHFRIGTSEYINILLDTGSFVETNINIRSSDPLKFVDSKPYSKRIEENLVKTKTNDALTTGTGKMGGRLVSLASMNFNFIGGSMGAVVGEKFYRAAKLAIDKKCAFIVICATGGARMQEAAFSLMQMAKTSAVLVELAEAKLPYITILTDPTTGGVSASFGMLGDVIIAEPGALIGFAGQRVIEQTIKKKLPPGFQKAELVLQNGFLDMIVPRQEMKKELIKMLEWFFN